MDSGTPPVEKTKQIFSLGAGKTADRLLGLDGLQRIYDARPSDPGAAEFIDWALEFMRIDVEVSEPEVERIPSDGPLVVVANHPFGGIEGLILGHLCCDAVRMPR